MIEFVPLGDRGRRYTSQVIVRLSDANPSGALRLDGVARFLQDVATEDWEDTGIVSDYVWVVRRAVVRRASGDWPRMNARLALTTWCSGVGAAWAERRTDVRSDGEVVLEAAVLWVPVDTSGHPVRIQPHFLDVYGEAIQGRKVPGRVTLREPPPDAVSQGWPLRRADLDVVGHVNNAAVWQAVSEVVDVPVSEVEVIHHGPVESGHEVRLVHTSGAMWLLVDDQVRVSAQYRV
ncbi:MAG: acyl-ACP thioesterase domain-containing protein [Acidimicrobiales bacterium]